MTRKHLITHTHTTQKWLAQGGGDMVDGSGYYGLKYI